MSPQSGQTCWLQFPGSLVGGGTRRSVGNPSVSHSEYEPVTCTIVVSGLMIKGSRGAPDDVAMALGAGFLEGTVTGVTL